MQSRFSQTSDNCPVPYLNKGQRVSILVGFRDYLRENYIGWDYKKQRRGIDGDTIFSKAIMFESSVPAGTSQLERAQSNLDFFDRLRRLVAAFEDSHLVIRPLQPFPYVSSGLHLFPADGRCFVSGVDERFTRATANKSGQHNNVDVGDELLRVDESRLADAVAELVPFISASSPDAAWAKAACCLTCRNFNFPKVARASYRLRSAKDQKEYDATFEWHEFSEPERWDARSVLSDRGVLPIGEFLTDIEYEVSQDDAPHAARSHASVTPFSELERITAYFQSDHLSEKALETGFWTYNRKEYAVVRIYEMLDELFTESGRISFRNAFSAFLRHLQQRGLPLIMDARHNRGGSGELSMFVGSFFCPPNEGRSPCLSTTLISRVEDELLSVLEESVPALQLSRAQLREIYSMLGADAIHGMPGPLVARGPDLPIPDSRVFLFENPTVLLISHECGSAGDVLAWLLKSNDRVQLMGSRTEGAGFGFRREAGEGRPQFRDNLEAIRVDVPNQAWGRPATDEMRCWDQYEDYWPLLVENVPVEPDVHFLPREPATNEPSAEYFRKAADLIRSTMSSGGHADLRRM